MPRESLTGEQGGILLDEFLLVCEIMAEQGERLNARAAAEDDLGPALGNRVGVEHRLKHADRIVGAQYGHRRAEADSLGAGSDRGEDHVPGRRREAVGAMLPIPKKSTPARSA